MTVILKILRYFTEIVKTLQKFIRFLKIKKKSKILWRIFQQGIEQISKKFFKSKKIFKNCKDISEKFLINFDSIKRNFCKPFFKIITGEFWKKIVRIFSVGFAEIVTSYRTILRKLTLRTISWKIMKEFGKILKFFSKIVYKLGKFIIFLRKIRKILKI